MDEIEQLYNNILSRTRARVEADCKKALLEADDEKLKSIVIDIGNRIGDRMNQSIGAVAQLARSNEQADKLIYEVALHLAIGMLIGPQTLAPDGRPEPLDEQGDRLYEEIRPEVEALIQNKIKPILSRYYEELGPLSRKTNNPLGS